MAINVKRGSAGRKKAEEVPDHSKAPEKKEEASAPPASDEDILGILEGIPISSGSDSEEPGLDLDLGMTTEEVRKAVVGEVAGLSEAGAEVLNSLVEKVEEVHQLLTKEAAQGQQALVGLTDSFNLLSEKVENLTRQVTTLTQSVGQLVQVVSDLRTSPAPQSQPSQPAPTPTPASSQPDPEERVPAIMKSLPKGKQFPLGPFVQRMVERFGLDADSVMVALKKGGYVQGNVVKT